ncbi:MAG TPA: selenocysteine-specific translation elongation factor [Candidatus Acidoferrum sp.]|nr:selenocysteine-specific translation elongation factor [Candidatus Acidoferrum sp.]
MNAPRRNIMLGTAGHVDHGKTALVKMLTGCETDTLAEEKQRGLTIDLGFAPCRLADKRIVGVVDVPGHVDFIRNMAAGAHGIDVVIFVVAADDGIMPQTHEHLHILTLMGLRHGLVALTKIDLVDPARRAFVLQDLRRLLANTFLAEAPICPLSNVTGEGFDAFFDALNDVVARCEDRPCAGCFRMWVEDVFTIRGSGTVITGIPTRGRVRPGDHLHLLPAGLSGHVRRMQVYGEDAVEGRAGECVALNIPELDHEAVRRGMVLSESKLPAPVTMAEAELRILDAVKGKVPDYLEAQLHVGTAAVSAHLAMLENTEMAGGQKQMIQLRLAEPLALAPGERFVIRANVAGSGIGLTTIGGGQILGIGNVRLRRKKQWTLDLLAARRNAIGDPVRWGELMLRESTRPASMAELQEKCLMRPDGMTALLDSLRADGRAVPTPGGAWLHRDVIQKTATDILAAIQAFHSANPQRSGLGREELLARLKTDGLLLDAAVESLLQSKQIERNGTVLAQAGSSAQLSGRDQQLCDRIAAKLQQSGWTPPAPEELAAALGEPLSRVTAMIRLLTERGLVVRLDDRIWMHRDAVETGKQTALKLFARAPMFSTMDFRDALGVSRKYAVPLVDYLDKIRFTVRSGNHRTPGMEAKKLLKP